MRVHKLLGIADPTAAPQVRFRLAAINKGQGIAQTQTPPLPFNGAVRDFAVDPPPGLNIRALLSAAYDTALRASELRAVAVGHI